MGSTNTQEHSIITFALRLRGPSKCRHMGTGGRGGLMSMQKFPYKFLKGLSRPSKKKGIQKWAGIVVKSEKRSGAVRKDYD